MTIDLELLRQWRAMADAATPGPWTAKTRSTDGRVDHFLGAEIAELEQPERGQFVNIADAIFIAAARSAMPALLDEVHRLQAAASMAAAILQRAMDDSMSDEWPDLHGDVIRYAIRTLTEGDPITQGAMNDLLRAVEYTRSHRDEFDLPDTGTIEVTTGEGQVKIKWVNMDGIASVVTLPQEENQDGN